MSAPKKYIQTAADAMGTVAVIGSGLIGCGWAIVFARAGWQVKVHDIHPAALDRARRAVDEQLQILVEHRLCTMPSVVIGSIEYEGDFEKAVEDVDYVQECGPEILDVKQDLFTRLDEISSPKTVLASSTSGFMASQFSAHIPGRHRVLVVHPVNPPHLVPLVEISPSEWTDPDVTKTAHDIMSAIGQTPVTVQKEIPGFILNRLQGALLNEALRLAQGGFATPEDIDKTVRDGLGLRWSFMGPFETIDLNAPAGLADYAKRYGPMYRDMAQSQSDVPGWHEDAIAPVHNARREELNIEDLTKRQYWRDRQLAALVAHKQKQDQ